MKIINAILCAATAALLLCLTSCAEEHLNLEPTADYAFQAADETSQFVTTEREGDIEVTITSANVKRNLVAQLFYCQAECIYAVAEGEPEPELPEDAEEGSFKATSLYKVAEGTWRLGIHYKLPAFGTTNTTTLHIRYGKSHPFTVTIIYCR